MQRRRTNCSWYGSADSPFQHRAIRAAGARARNPADHPKPEVPAFPGRDNQRLHGSLLMHASPLDELARKPLRRQAREQRRRHRRGGRAHPAGRIESIEREAARKTNQATFRR